jgi:predicted ATP-grasp superfamily ATP-dependent carboligase
MHLLRKHNITSSSHRGADSPAVVFGLFETGLGVIRSLGREGIPVMGIDFKKDIARYSHYVKPMLCPHPQQEESLFIEWIISTFSGQKHKCPVFFSSDDFLISFSRNRLVLSNYFLFNLVDHSLLESISNKYSQYKLASNAGCVLPATWVICNKSELDSLHEAIHYPVFVKGLDVNSWRRKISGSVKGFLVRDLRELHDKVNSIVAKDVPVILQEVIPGPDINHYKYCSYTSSSGEILAEFTLRKIRQNPIRFGVGAVVESIYNQELIMEGRKLFKGINFRGIGSAEFKLDEKDGRLKLIELNPRYWQQNFLSTECGINFPFINWSDLYNKRIPTENVFKTGIKWINRYLDFDSFLSYNRKGELSFWNWRKSLKGKSVYSDFTWDDPLPFLYEFRNGKRFLNIPRYLRRKLFS